MRIILPLVIGAVMSFEAAALTDDEKSSIKMEAEIVGGWAYCAASLEGTNPAVSEFLMTDVDRSNKNAKTRFGSDGFAHFAKVQNDVVASGYSDYLGEKITKTACAEILKAKGF